MTDAVDYTAPPHDLAWSWAERGKVVSWSNGQTVVFVEELIELLTPLAEEGLVALDPLIMLLMVCRHGGAGVEAVMTTVRHRLDELDEGGRRVPRNLAGRVRSGLQRVADIDEQLRHSVSGRCQLLALVCAGGGADRMTVEQGRAAVGAIRQGQMSITPTAADSVRWLSAMRLIAQGAGSLSDEAITQRHATGLAVEVKAAESLVEVPLPMAVGRLIDALQDDPQLSGLAQLAHDLRAITSIARPMIETEQLATGGFSDLSNRGPLDRLLVSELAQDELLLTARLAMGEALYLRREQSARPPNHSRLIYYQSGLLSWGVVRLLMTAACMALIAGSTTDELIVVRGVDGRIESMPLADRDDVLAQLEVLGLLDDPVGHLEQLNDRLCGEQSDVVLVLPEDGFNEPDYRRGIDRSLDRERCRVHVLTVCRSGRCVLLRRTDNGYLPIHAATVDLSSVLAAGNRSDLLQDIVDQKTDPALPAYCRLVHPPLRMPIVVGRTDCRRLPDGSYLSMDKRQCGRLLWWNDPRRGPVEVARTGLDGQLMWVGESESDEQPISAVVQTFDGRSWLLQMDLPAGKVQIEDAGLSAWEHGESHRLLTVGEDHGMLMGIGRTLVRLADCVTGRPIGVYCIGPGWHWQFDRVFMDEQGNYFCLGRDGDQARMYPLAESAVRQWRDTVEAEEILPGKQCSVFRSLTGVGVHDGMLWLLNKGRKRYALQLHNRRLIPVPVNVSQVSEHLQFYHFRKMVGGDGSHLKLSAVTLPGAVRVVMDNRGLLHFQAESLSLPELTLALHVGPIAGWLSDGRVFGDRYFFNADLTPTETADVKREVLDRYIEAVL